MMVKPKHQGYMIFLRYGYLLFFFIGLIEDTKSMEASKVIVFLLLYIINNQLRFFMMPKNKLYLVLSLVLEIILSCYLFTACGIFGSLIFICSLIDIIYAFNSIAAASYVVVISIFIIYQVNYSKFVVWAIAALPLLLILEKLKEEQERKIEAQDLYDKLREKDEELKKANKELEGYVNTAEEITLLRERNRISREIHDNVGHALSTMIIQLGAIEKIGTKNGEEAARMAGNLVVFAKESMERVRAAVREMKPRELEEYEGVLAVSEMIKNFQKLTGVEVKLRVSDKVWKLNSDQTMVIYRILQEFLSNSVRHGKATEVRIFLNFFDNGLRIHAKDNGIGCSSVKSGVGLKSIKERVQVWGGQIEYFTEEGKGFELIVTMEKAKLSIDGIEKL